MTTPILKALRAKALMSDAQLTQEQISAEYIEKALENDILLSRMPIENASSPDFKKNVLKVYTSVETGTEGITPTLSTTPVYISQSATFMKNESLVDVTHEITQDSQIDVIQHVYSQIGSVTAVKMQNDMLNDNTVFGLANFCIDKEAQNPSSSAPYEEALKDDADRDDYIFNVTKSGVLGEWAADSEGKVKFLGDLVASVPSRYGMAEDFAIYMNRKNWFEEFNFLADTTGNVINYNVTPLTWMGYPIVLMDGLADDVIFVGSLSNAYETVLLEGSEKVIEEEFTMKGQSQIYVSNRFAGLPLDNTAIRFGVQAV
ncbi:phage major capsid protein [Vibrio coralliilyticus]|uniref:phage major capsid protein n=1 Tax=Vibrio coralliilyticus TaxID=190893 RepID=UPI0015601622|nr:phage major capsid protein [Vibrio coralliilyticus]NRF16616.1 phage major capsid protein [Vibrio coralliilyticus]